MRQGKRKAQWLSLIVAAAMVLCMLPMAAFAAGDEGPTLTLNMPDTFTVGEPVEFSVTTTKGNAAENTMVIGTAEFDGAEAVEKIEYYEVKDGNWYELTGDSFGPSSGFPLSDATSKFRVTFKEAGSYSLTVKIVKVDGGDVLLEKTCTITSTEPASITGVKVVDGTDGYTEVTAPKAGQKLTANIQTSEGEIGSYPVDEKAHYKWYYEGSDAVLGTEPTYTVTGDNVGKVLCVDVTVDGYEGSATWKATAAVVKGTITGVKVVDGTDGYTEVTVPKVGQKLTANIQTSEGEIGSYPVNEDAHYKWYYEGSDAVLGTEPTYTVTGDNVGKVLCVDVTVDGYEGSATWKATAAVALPALVPAEDADIAIEGAGDEKYVTGVMAGMDADAVIALFEEAQAGTWIVVLDQEGNELGEKLVGTGCTVKLVDEVGVILDAVVVVIDGDVQGDGAVNVLDLIAMAQHVTNGGELAGVYFQAGDVNTDDRVDVLDMIAVCQSIIA